MLDNMERTALADILVNFFGAQMHDKRARFKEKTLEATELMLEEIQKCDRRIKILFSSLRCAMVGKGWLRRCLKAVLRIVNENGSMFNAWIGCTNTLIAKHRTEIELTLY